MFFFNFLKKSKTPSLSYKPEILQYKSFYDFSWTIYIYSNIKIWDGKYIIEKILKILDPKKMENIYPITK